METTGKGRIWWIDGAVQMGRDRETQVGRSQRRKEKQKERETRGGKVERRKKKK